MYYGWKRQAWKKYSFFLNKHKNTIIFKWKPIFWYKHLNKNYDFIERTANEASLGEKTNEIDEKLMITFRTTKCIFKNSWKKTNKKISNLK